MGTIRIFLLRLWVDPAGPEILRGLLQPLPEGEALSFADEQALIVLLRRLLFAPKGPERLDQRGKG